MARWTRRRRSVEQRVTAAQAARSVSVSVAVDALPITQGLVQLTADVVSSLELSAVDDRTGRVLTDPPELLVRPDPREDRADTLHKIVQALYWGGNAPCSVGRPGTPNASLRVLNPITVGYEPDPFDSTWLRHWYVDGYPQPIDALAVFKMNDDPRRGPLGRSPFVQCEAALNLYGWAYRYLLDYYAQGGAPSLVLRSARPLSSAPVAEDTAGRTEAQIAQDAWVSSRQLYRPAVLDPQWTLEGGPVPQDLEQTVRVLEFAGQEVGRLTNTPPTIANVLASGSLTYSTTAEELRRWLLLNLGPTWLRRIERKFSSLLPAGLSARFEQDSFTRFDVLENAAAVSSAPVRELRAVS
jgi:hypothetical protein